MSKPAVGIKFDDDNSGKPSAPRSTLRFEQILGNIRQVDAEPTWTPRGRLEDSIALLIDAGTPNLCVYDYQGKEWLFAELSDTRIP